MSKKQLVQFLEELETSELKEQILDLYARFKNVKEFYDFSFNPNEDRRIQEAKYKIGKEYFPENGRKAKKRRSIAQKQITHLLKLELDPIMIADLMLFNIEVAQSYTAEKSIKQESFYKSMLSSYNQAISFIGQQYIQAEFIERVHAILKKTEEQNWPNAEGFLRVRLSLQTD